MKIAFYTLGCKVNQFDEAMMIQRLTNHGIEVVPFNSMADVYIINTCTVTGKTDFQSRQAIRKAIKRSHAPEEKKQKGKVIVTGCYAQINHEEINSIGGVSLVLGNLEKENIEKYINEISQSGKTFSHVDNTWNVNKFQFTAINGFGKRTRAFVKIQDGCNSKCSYCIVPLARGQNRSLDETKVIEQIKELMKRGYKEIVLTGIHLGTYGEDFMKKTNLSSLLEKIKKIKGDFRIRLSSVEPNEITDELIHVIGSSEKICPHLHIPLQSGDDGILKMMNRDYTVAFYRNLIEKLSSRIKNINIGTDIIAGFPGEKEEQFLNTSSLIKDLPLGYLHIFPYSKRALTPAALFPEQLHPAHIKERSRHLREIGEIKKSQFRKRFLGKTMSVLVEGKKDTKTGLLKGFTENYIPVSFKGNEEFKNKILPIELQKIEGSTVLGKVL